MIPESKKIRLPVLGGNADLVALEPFALPTSNFLPVDVPPITLAELNLPGRTEIRTSSYTIYVDLPGSSDEMLLVHGYTGAYDRVSKRVATFLRSREPSHAPKPLYGDWSPERNLDGTPVELSDESMAILEKRGYLVRLTVEEEESLFVKLAARHHQTAVTNAPGYVIMPTYQCNLRCPYCFQDHMRTDPRNAHLLQSIDLTMANRILAGMDTIDAAHGMTPDRKRSITFFGGEPLLAYNRPIIEHLINGVLKRGKASFMAVTNATEIDGYMDLMSPEMLSLLQITIDGPPAEHDRRRIYPDGSGSFAKIAANIAQVLERGTQVSVRMNIDRNNIETLPTLMESFREHGFLGHKLFRSYVAPIHGGNGHVDEKTTYNSWQLGRAMEKLREAHPELASIGMSDDMLQNQARQVFNKIGTGRPMFRTAFCGAHSTMYVIDSFGDIYACWERTGDPSQRIGRIEDEGRVLMKRSLMERWRGRSVVSNSTCRKCRYATSCGGGCAVLAEEASGDAYTNHCDGFAKRFRSSVAEAFQEYMRGEQREISVTRLCDV